MSSKSVGMVHVAMPYRITREWVEVYRRQGELDRGWPRCAKCGGVLRIGSVIDHYWPYYSDHNSHLKCLNRMKASDDTQRTGTDASRARRNAGHDKSD